jgi:hypothetical protein
LSRFVKDQHDAPYVGIAVDERDDAQLATADCAQQRGNFADVGGAGQPQP